jgi:hypothetical protein
MKTFNYILKGILAASVMVFALASCSQDAMDAVNKDVNHTTDAPAKFVLADVITSTAQNNVGGDINTYCSAYNEQEAGCHNQLWRAELRAGEPSTSSTFDNTWANIYSTLKNARIVVAKCSDGGTQEGSLVTKGMGEVMVALNSGILTDMFGDVPYTKAAQPTSLTQTTEYMNPALDKQSAIYTAIDASLDAAISDLAKGSDNPGTYDMLYGGDASLWTKFAYGLKARYAMRRLDVTSDKTATLKAVIEYCDKSFTSAAEQASYSHYDANNINPTFDFQWSRDALGASESMSKKLAARSDPRERRNYVDPSSWVQLTGTTDKAFFPAPNGNTEQSQAMYTYSMFMYAQVAPVHLMSYHEVLFLKAEALVRLNRLVEAAVVLQQAVVAAIANNEVNIQATFDAPTVNGYGGIGASTDPVTEAEAISYCVTSVLPRFASAPLKETMIQKYIAMWGANGEAEETYNDIRRLKALGEFSLYELANANNATKYPLRLPYGSSDTTTNPNITEVFGTGVYVYSDPVWWAGGTH